MAIVNLKLIPFSPSNNMFPTNRNLCNRTFFIYLGKTVTGLVISGRKTTYTIRY